MLDGRVFPSLIFILCVSSTVSITPIKYMKMYCHGNPIFVNTSLILELTNELLEEVPEDELHCVAKILTYPGSRLLLHFVTLDISYHNLSPDRLTIFDYDTKGNTTQVSPVGGLYGIYDQYYKHTSSGVEDYLSSSNMFRLDYMGKPSLLYRGFRILVTSFKDPNADGSCLNYYSRCAKGSICIPTITLCNGDNNCGSKDDSDETQCNWVLSTGLEEKYAVGNIVTCAVLSCLSFIIVVVLVFGFIFKYNKRRYLKREDISVHAKRIAAGKWRIINDMGLTSQIYAPPNYDDVVADDEREEPPPAYESLPCSVRNSCELRTSPSGVTIVCIESRDIHLYNEGSDVPNVRCFVVDNDEEYIEEVHIHSDTSHGSRSESNSNNSSYSSNRSLAILESNEENVCKGEYVDDSDTSSQNMSLLKADSPRKIDSNENLIRKTVIGIVDDEIQYMDD